jgi:hypothetical protein
MTENRNKYILFAGKLEEKRHKGRPRCRRVDNINMDMEEIGWGGMDCIDLAQNTDIL